MLLLTLLQFIKQSLKLYRIKVVFVEKDMSQTQLAQLLGKSFSSVNAYCSNRTQPLLDVLKQIADIPPKEYEDYFNRKASLLLIENGAVKISQSKSGGGYGVGVTRL